DMERRLGDRVELHLARQGAVCRPIELEVDQMRVEAGARQRATEFARLQADQHRILLVAIDDRRNASRAPHCPGRALAGALARLGAEADDLGHRLVTPLCKKMAGRPAHPPIRRRRLLMQSNSLETEWPLLIGGIASAMSVAIVCWPTVCVCASSAVATL